MQEIQQSLAALKLGAPQVFRNLAFENSSAEKILLVDGDELVGAKQNRVINLSILVAGGAKVVIPVSCVEQGRWAYRSREFSSARRALLRGYALDAIETANGKTLAPPEAEVRRFLERVQGATAERFAALGEGEDFRLSGEGVSGGALATGGRVVHLAGYAMA